MIACTKPKTDTVNPPPPPPPIIESKVPRLSTSSISDLTLFSVTLGGNIIDTGGSKLTEQGIVVGLSAGPTIDTNFNKFPMQADNNGNFSRIIIDIPPRTNFYIRAYGINKQGVGYGNEVRFTSLNEKVFHSTGVFILTTQQQVNDFGADNYTTLVNGITLDGPDIRDLTPLKSLVILGGEINILHTSLANLKGLDNIEIIGNGFYNSSFIEHNSLLTNLSGLNKVKIIRGILQINDNASMVNLEGLNSLTQIEGGDLGIYNCNKLETLNGLENLLFIDGTLDIHKNSSLKDLRGLKNLTNITRDIRMSENDVLPNVDGLEKLSKLQFLDLRYNPSLTQISGLRNLTTLNGCYIDDNESLSSLSAFQNLKTIQYLTIKRSNSIVDLRGLSNLESITGTASIEFNQNLTSLKGLEKLQSAYQLGFGYNNSLTDLTSLGALKAVGSLGFAYNNTIKSLNGLEGLRQVDERLDIEYNPLLSEFCALKPFLMQYTGNGLIITNNAIPITKELIIATCP